MLCMACAKTIEYLICARGIYRGLNKTTNQRISLPCPAGVHVRPSPVYLGLQVQLYDPCVLLHTALRSQLL